MKSLLSVLLSLFILTSFLHGQSTVQLFLEDFNGPNLYFQLNSAGLGSNSGNNTWVINNSYDGMGVKPNTTSQDSTFGGK